MSVLKRRKTNKDEKQQNAKSNQDQKEPKSREIEYLKSLKNFYQGVKQKNQLFTRLRNIIDDFKKDNID